MCLSNLCVSLLALSNLCLSLSLLSFSPGKLSAFLFPPVLPIASAAANVFHFPCVCVLVCVFFGFGWLGCAMQKPFGASKSFEAKGSSFLSRSLPKPSSIKEEEDDDDSDLSCEDKDLLDDDDEEVVLEEDINEDMGRDVDENECTKDDSTAGLGVTRNVTFERPVSHT